VGHVYAEVAARHGFDGLDPAELDRRFAAAWQRKGAFAHTRRQWAELVDRTFAGLVSPPPSRTFFDAIYERFAERRAWRVYPDVLPTLQSLRAGGMTLAALSNWDDRLRPLLHGLELDHYFQAIIVSCEVGAVKPDPAIFQVAGARLGLPPTQIVHVGDSPCEDLAGATAAGCAAVLLVRHGRAAAPPHTIRSLSELPAVMGTAPAKSDWQHGVCLI
jgi:putative hydrolase of the HAD superfamily